MKRIVIFCDGTWSSIGQGALDSRGSTHVARLTEATLHYSPDGVQQLVVYVPGLGVGTGSSRLSRYIDIIGGGAFGWGLKQNLESAVFQLAMNFEPGDEIFIFGYSRGAYTAFLLSWFVNVCGIPPRNGLRSIPEMVEHFAKAERGSRGNSVKDFEFRARNSPLVSTTLEEQRWRQERDLGPSV